MLQKRLVFWYINLVLKTTKTLILLLFSVFLFCLYCKLLYFCYESPVSQKHYDHKKERREEVRLFVSIFLKKFIESYEITLKTYFIFWSL